METKHVFSLTDDETMILLALDREMKAVIAKASQPPRAYLQELAKRYEVDVNKIEVTNDPADSSKLILVVKELVSPDPAALPTGDSEAEKKKPPR